MPHRLSTAHALHSFGIQERDHICMLCSVAMKLQPPTTLLTPQQILSTALFTAFHVEGNPRVHTSSWQNGTRGRDDHGVIPVLFGRCLRISSLHALVYILKTFCDFFAIYYVHLLPPLFFLGGSSGFGSGFGALKGGGSKSLSSFFSTSSLKSVDKCMTSRQKTAAFTPTATES